MKVEVTKDPRTRKELMIGEGKVAGVYFNELKEKRSYGDKGWTPTHAINLRMEDGTNVGLGLKVVEEDKDRRVNVKDVDDNWAELTKGAVVSLVLEDNGEYKGKKQYNSKASDVVLLEKGLEPQKKAEQGNSSSSGYQKKDNSGIEAGHAINAAYCLVGHKQDSAEQIVELAKELHEITVGLKAEYKEANPDLSDYDVGAKVGHAVLNACQMLTKTKVDKVADTARAILSKVSEPVLEYIKGVAPQKQEEPAQEPEPEDNSPQGDDFDDLPF